MAHEQQPSVEEILESIKKVIARDNREQPRSARQQREGDGVMLQHPVIEKREDVLDLAAAGTALGEAGPGSDPSSAAADGLTTEQAAERMRQSLAALAMLAEPAAPPQIVRSGETSLEQLTRELLRPMLAQWLDAHLPAMVERLVKAEIARIAGKRG